MISKNESKDFLSLKCSNCGNGHMEFVEEIIDKDDNHIADKLCCNKCGQYCLEASLII